MDIFGLSVFGIIAATVVGMVLGALWYSPLLFGNLWMKAIGKTPDTLGSATGPMIGSVVACFMKALGVAILFKLIGVDSLSMAVGVGLILGLLFIFPAMLSDSLFCGWGTPLLLIQSGYRALSVVLMSIAMCFL